MSLLTFAIPSKNRHAALRRSMPLLLRAARHTQSPIIICDQSSTPMTVAELSPLPGDHLTIIHRPKLNGLPAARNVLLAHCTTPLICFLDDDTDVSADFSQQAEHLARTEPELAAWGPIIETRSLWHRRLHRLAQIGCMADPRRLTTRPASYATTSLFGCCFVVRTEIACQVGFDARRSGYALGEDHDFFLRLPGHKRFALELRAIHRQESDNRANPQQRGLAKGRYLRWLADRHGGRNPATLAHLLMALAAAASGAGHEPAAWRSTLVGAFAPGRRYPA